MHSTNSVQPAKAFISAHALLRAQQRGIKQPDLDMVFNYGDREKRARGGCYRLSISNRQMRRLLDRKIITPSQAERCSRLTLVTDGFHIATNYRASRTH
jgi:hypothetical protein